MRRTVTAVSCLGTGVLVAAALPPWGWWPLAFAGLVCLDRLAPGDPLVFRMSDGSVLTYELTSTEIVGSDAMHIVDQAPEHTATLFACHPKGSAAQRIVAHFRLAAGGA